MHGLCEGIPTTRGSKHANRLLGLCFCAGTGPRGCFGNVIGDPAFALQPSATWKGVQIGKKQKAKKKTKNEHLSLTLLHPRQ